MKYYIVNALISEKTKSLLKNHGRLIEIFAHPFLPVPEKHHTDMQFAKINDYCGVYAPNFTISDNSLLQINNIYIGNTILKDKYPGNIAYNILRCGNDYFHNVNYTDSKVKENILLNGGTLHHVKQGYAGCSSVSVPLKNGKYLLISSDIGIVTYVRKSFNNIISEYFEDTKKILLPGYDHGFIGGCAGYDNDLGLLIYGKINGQLKELSIKYNFPILSIFDNALTDIGGISVMYSNL